jgi:hypothetical protein
MLFGIMYPVVGITFAELPNPSEMVMWRRAAWLVSAAAFAVHIAYEHFRLRHSPRSTAWHVSLAVALGAFGLAAAANFHELWATERYRRAIALALVSWPVVTAVPAFLVALAAAAALARMCPPKD